LKTDTAASTFQSERGPLAWRTGKISGSNRWQAQSSEFQWMNRHPRRRDLWHANMSADLIDAAIRNGAKGIVVAGVGDGNMTTPALDALTAAAKNGIVVVRSTRLASGITLRNNEVNDDEKGFVASGELNPAKSRVLLQLALTQTKDPVRIQKMFYEY
jgi:L-asparaginase